MGDIEINNHIINVPLIDILRDIQSKTSYLKQIKPSSNSIMITCPFHSNHNEKHPSCGVDNDENSDTYGFFNCFTCGAKGPFFKLVAECFNVSDEYAKEWLVDNYCDIFEDEDYFKDLIKINKEEYLDENILDKYNFRHPYMYERKLKDDIIEKFKVGYDAKNDSLTFPIWNEDGKLVGITRRSVMTKKFDIPKGLNKPVYLFNEIKKNNSSSVIVCESQIDALTAWGYGTPAVALLGVGSKDQYNILNRIHPVWITMFDNDDAGRKATDKFNKMIRKDCIVVNVKIPDGKKDINDLSEEEFKSLLNSYNLI